MALTLRALKRPPILTSPERVGVSGNFTVWRDLGSGKEYAKQNGGGNWFRVVHPDPAKNH